MHFKKFKFDVVLFINLNFMNYFVKFHNSKQKLKTNEKINNRDDNYINFYLFTSFNEMVNVLVNLSKFSNLKHFFDISADVLKFAVGSRTTRAPRW